MIGPSDTGKPLRRGIITIAIMMATVMQVLDTTIVNVALPHMQGSLTASQDEITWVLTSYIVAAAVMTPATGWAGERFGRTRLFMLSVAAFTIASVLCGLATSLTEIVLFRILQGMFGAALVPLSQAVLLDTYPRERHGSAMALWGVGIMIGPILGPTLGGYLTEYYNWRWVFYINLPIGVAALILIRAFVPETGRERNRPLDVFGFLALSVGIGALQLMLDRGQTKDWFGSAEIVTETIIAAFGFYLYLVHALTTERPYLDLRLLKDRNFAVGLIFIFILGVILFATIAIIPPFLQNLLDYPVLTTGLVMAPRGIGTMISMILVGRLITRVDARLLIFAGFVLAAESLWDMSGFSLDVTEWDIVRTGVIQGLGLGLIFVPLSTIAFATLAPVHRTEAAGLFSLLRNIGSSIGISLVVLLLTRGTQINHANLAGYINPFNLLFRAYMELPPVNGLDQTHALALLNAEINRQAALIAYVNDFRFLMYMTLAAVPLILLLGRPARGQADTAPVME